jgi:hypothetical protein
MRQIDLAILRLRDLRRSGGLQLKNPIFTDDTAMKAPLLDRESSTSEASVRLSSSRHFPYSAKSSSRALSGATVPAPSRSRLYLYCKGKFKLD